MGWSRAPETTESFRAACWSQVAQIACAGTATERARSFSAYAEAVYGVLSTAGRPLFARLPTVAAIGVAVACVAK